MDAFLARLSLRLPSPLRRHLPAERIAMAGQFLRFGLVGALGFVVDTAIVYSTRPLLGLYWGGAVAYLGAATTTWAVNRLWTFRTAPRAAAFRQWALFLSTNALGFALNRGTYALLVTAWDMAWREPIIAVAAGSLAGMALNFHFSRTIVFKK